MSEQSSVGERAKEVADRVGVRVAELRALGKRILERVPARVRSGMRRALSLAFFIAIGWVLYGQLSELDWPEVLRKVSPISSPMTVSIRMRKDPSVCVSTVNVS